MSLTRQMICTGLACFLCLSMGITYTWPSSAMKLFGSENTTLHRPMTETELAIFSSLSSIGALVATPIAGFMLDSIGRKNSSIILTLSHIICWTMLIASNRVEVLFAAVFISGLGGAAFLVIPLYISEFCLESIRGGMTSGAYVFFSIGMIVAYAVGGYVDYYPMVYVYLIIAVVVIVLLGILKESPLFLMMKGREEEAKVALGFFLNEKTDSKLVTYEMENIRRSLNAELDQPDKTLSLLYGEYTPEEEFKLTPLQQTEKLTTLQFIRKSSSTRQALFVATVLMTASMFQGLVAVQVYADLLFSEAIPTMSSTVSSIILSVVTVLAGFTAAYLTERAGRKPLMFWSCLASGVSCVLLGSQIHQHWGPHELTALLVYLFCVVYTLGAGTIPSVLSAELFLPEVKSFIQMLITEWAWLCNFIILFIFFPLVQAIELGPVFYLFAVISFATAIFTYFYLPETRGLPIDDIQRLFSKKKKYMFSHP